MAKDGVHLTFVGLCDNNFYFDATGQDELDTDGFQRSETAERLIRGPENKFLILNEAKEFDLRDLNFQQQSYSDYKLYITFYKDLSQKRDIRLVTLYALKDDKKYAAVCINDQEVIAEEVKELQTCIESSQHKALFYMVPDKLNFFKLKSSLYPDKILGFDQTDFNKLILRPNDSDNQYDRLEIMF